MIDECRHCEEIRTLDDGLCVPCYALELDYQNTAEGDR